MHSTSATCSTKKGTEYRRSLWNFTAKGRAAVGLADRLQPKQPKVWVYDIETSPHLAYTYNLYNADIRPDMIVEPSRMLCWAGMWLGEHKVAFYS